MHQHPPKIPLCRNTIASNAPHVSGRRATIRYAVSVAISAPYLPPSNVAERDLEEHRRYLQERIPSIALFGARLTAASRAVHERSQMLFFSGLLAVIWLLSRSS